MIRVSFDELQSIIMVYRNGTLATFQTYLDKTTTFKESEIPTADDSCPATGYTLPTPEVFLDSVNNLASKQTLKGILKI